MRDYPPSDSKPYGPFPDCLLDTHLSRRFSGFFQAKSTHLRQSLHRKQLLRWRPISRHVTCFPTPLTRPTPAFHDLCELYDPRHVFSVKKGGFCCMITHANFLRKHCAIINNSSEPLYIYPLVHPDPLSSKFLLSYIGLLISNVTIVYHPNP